jgi:hypothetical protein
MKIYVIVEEQEDGSIYVHGDCFTEYNKANEVWSYLRKEYPDSLYDIYETELAE